jgi:hypothetical protein
MTPQLYCTTSDDEEDQRFFAQKNYCHQKPEKKLKIDRETYVCILTVFKP